ncbi:MFS transporter [Fimbriiglobus ruber]|uniref:D-galactonate transporter n=1 Tax=Fimbriiglobus ruber TaxID=1908690 RepID=A0A225CZ02_9BACT|nr:MFS transporter [Fimbriiglobus ruber]OWK34482.1 D-galactonate transporter [Fimbriiglobus ruber]
MRYILLAFLCAATVIGYVQRGALGVPSKLIEGEFGLDPADMGTIMAAWFWGYSLCQLPSGWVAERLGSKPALLLFMVGWSVLTGLSGLATGFAGLICLWGLMGCVQAGLFPCATKAVGATFPLAGQAFASGALSGCMALGGASAHRIMGQLIGSMSWHQILALYALPGLVWAVGFALVVPSPEGQKTGNQAGAKRKVTGPVNWLKLVTDRQMQLICGQQFFRAAAMAFFYTWFPRFLKETQGLPEKEAGELASWPPLAGLFGGLLGGLFSEWILKRTGSPRLARQGMACAAMTICATVAIGSFFTTDKVFVVILMCVAAFFGMAGGVSGYAVSIAYGGSRVATVFATMNMSGNIGAALFPLIVGWLVRTTGNWNLALLVFASLFAADVICWAVLNPKGTLFPETEPAQERT